MTPAQCSELLRVAHSAIEYGLSHGSPAPAPESADPALAGHGACFVTLKRLGELRGCIGSIDPVRPLIEDAAANAWAAAFRDPRFAPLSSAEWPDTHLSLSVLTPRESLVRGGRQQLLGALRPGVDGLVIAHPDGRQATFLPAVWEQLPDPDEFLDHLLSKAGLPVDQDIAELHTWRYQVQSIGEDQRD